MTTKLTGWLQARPRRTSWALLSLGMVIVLWVAAWDRGIATGHMLAMTVACIALAGLCVRIVGWE
jgi:hypothetical protein